MTEDLRWGLNGKVLVVVKPDGSCMANDDITLEEAKLILRDVALTAARLLRDRDAAIAKAEILDELCHKKESANKGINRTVYMLVKKAGGSVVITPEEIISMNMDDWLYETSNSIDGMKLWTHKKADPGASFVPRPHICGDPSASCDAYCEENASRGKEIMGWTPKKEGASP